MNKIKTYLAFVTLIFSLYTEGVAQISINTDGTPASANTILDLNPSVGKAFVPPKMTWAQIRAISPALEGMTVYDTEFKTLRLYNGTRWMSLTQPTDASAPSGSSTAQAPTGSVTINAVAKAASGNIYITGYLSGAVTFGSVSVTATAAEFFLVKYNSSGVAQWVQKSTSNNGLGFAEGKALVVDGSENIYITGTFRTTPNPGGTVVFSGLASIESYPTLHDATDIFVVKYDAGGTALWVRREGGEGDYTGDAGTAITIDGSSVYVVGFFTPIGVGAFPPGSVGVGGVFFPNSNASLETFVVKYDLNGTPIWARNIDASVGFTVFGNSIVVDVSGNVFISGYFTGSALYNGTSTASTGLNDGFLAKYNSTGTLLWFTKTGGTGDDTNSGLTLDGSGNIYTAGSFSGSVTVPTTPSTLLTSAGGTDILVAKYNTSGVPQWAKRAGGTGNDSGASIAMDAYNNLFLTGSFTGTATFGTLPALTSAGNSDVFVAKYNSSGAEQWVQKAGGGGADSGRSIVVDLLGNVYTVGGFVPSAQFGNATLTTGQSFLMKYAE
jgi:Beta-propeller repeat